MSIPAGVLKPIGSRARGTVMKALGLSALLMTAFFFPFLADDYVLHLAILTGIAIILASSLNLITGYAGKLSLGHAAFYGIGAYASTLANQRLGIPVLVAMGLAGPMTAAIALVTGPVMLRLRGAHFIIVTLSFAIVVQLVFINWIWLTNGPTGIFGIDYPTFGSFALSDKQSYFYLVAACDVLTLLMLWCIVHSRLGRALIALRENEQLAASIGISSPHYSLLALVLAAGLAGWAGALYAHYVGVITPDLLGFDVMVSMLVMVVVGGKGTLLGPVLGAALVTFLPEQLRVLSDYRLTIFGILLMACVMALPDGIASLGSLLQRKLGKWV
ncbi:branched-chain amino acid ABC transporter permease [Tardiphaga sp. 866_E4_N2_1]|uniref:branched-chain amino acid ABC transporter permease n=1 Tax=unclassified Tardiphaga TaxID=2631404 RepID=UPI003F2252E4